MLVFILCLSITNILIEYKAYLEGFQNQWSDWNTKGVVSFKIYRKLCL
jgi:hypothetical protein